MSVRKRKAIRQAAYMNMPLFPWRSVKLISDLRRSMLKRGLPDPMLRCVDMGSIENFRFISW